MNFTRSKLHVMLQVLITIKFKAKEPIVNFFNTNKNTSKHLAKASQDMSFLVTSELYAI